MRADLIKSISYHCSSPMIDLTQSGPNVQYDASILEYQLSFLKSPISRSVWKLFAKGISGLQMLAQTTLSYGHTWVNISIWIFEVEVWIYKLQRNHWNTFNNTIRIAFLRLCWWYKYIWPNYRTTSCFAKLLRNSGYIWILVPQNLGM